MDIIRRIHEKMAERQLLFIFRGDITERNSLPLLTLLENEMKDDSYGMAGRKRLFMFVLESLQNIVKHGARHHVMMPLVAYSKAGEGYRVLTANVIAGDQAENLRKRLEQVNNLDGQGIKDLYKDILMNSEFNEKGGAGLGLIEMAVKTGNRLDFDFRPAGDGHLYFMLSKTVDSSGMGTHDGLPHQFSLNGDSIVQIEKMMAENNIYMIWSGHVSQGIGEEVLSITESRLSEEDVNSNLRRRVFNIMVEMLENVSKYNVGKENEKEYGMPVVVLRFDNGRFIITTANLVMNDKVDELNKKLDLVNSMKRGELKELFYSSLADQSIETDSTGNLGLVSMARKSGSNLDYHFQRISDRYSYFRLTVKAGKIPG